MMRIRVVGTEGQPISGSQAVLRNVLRAVDGLPSLGVPFYLVGLVVSSLGERFQRLGDWAAGTMVVVEEPQRHYGVVNVTEPEALRLAASIPPGFVVSRSLGRALSAYVQRRQVFPWRRRVEIAMHLAGPLREKFDLPANTSPDMLLCALYYRTFIGDQLQSAVDNNNPFALVQSVAVQPGVYAGVR
jgi:hypothetical protein